MAGRNFEIGGDRQTDIHTYRHTYRHTDIVLSDYPFRYQEGLKWPQKNFGANRRRFQTNIPIA